MLFGFWVLSYINLVFMEKWNFWMFIEFLFNNFFLIVEIIGVYRKFGNFYKYIEGNKSYLYFFYLEEILLLIFDVYFFSCLEFVNKIFFEMNV